MPAPATPPSPPPALPPVLLADLRTALGPDFAPDDEGHCALTVDGALTWHWQTEADATHATLFARLGSPSPEHAQGLALMMLAANLPGAGLDGAALGYSSTQQLAGLSLKLALTQPPPQLAARVLAFVDLALAWQAHLARWLEATADSSPAAPAPPPDASAAVSAPLSAANWLNQRA